MQSRSWKKSNGFDSFLLFYLMLWIKIFVSFVSYGLSKQNEICYVSLTYSLLYFLASFFNANIIFFENTLVLISNLPKFNWFIFNKIKKIRSYFFQIFNLEDFCEVCLFWKSLFCISITYLSILCVSKNIWSD